jgi:uncharacterized protein involved in response to NO
MAMPLQTSTAPAAADLRMWPSSPQTVEKVRAREEAFSRLLVAFISSGLAFMLLPGTFLGVWNLLRISGRESVAAISPAWLQAHGHAQVFGWIGSFILGIGFYSIPKLRSRERPAFGAAWACWVLWTGGVALRWFANVYLWQWRVLLPVSSVMELAAFLVFFRAVSQHQPNGSGNSRIEPWMWVVISASVGLLLSLLVNVGACSYLALWGAGPALPHVLDQSYLVLVIWGFLVPFVWGFSLKWMRVFLGLKPAHAVLLLAAVIANYAGIGLTLVDNGKVATLVFVMSSALAIAGLRMFEPATNEAKTRGVHKSFPVFIRVAYGWLLVGAVLGAVAARWDHSGGIWGASRHALTVGFIAIMVFSVGQRILPAFAGMRLLWSTKLMLASLALLALGCLLRVSSEVLAYQDYASWAWSILPVSATLELSAVMIFAINISGTLFLVPRHVERHPLVVVLPQQQAPRGGGNLGD